MELAVVIVVCVVWWLASRHADLWRVGEPTERDRGAEDGAFVEGYVIGRYVGERREGERVAAWPDPVTAGTDGDPWTLDGPDGHDAHDGLLDEVGWGPVDAPADEHDDGDGEGDDGSDGVDDDW